ncbi:AMP-binding protein [Gordonia sp. ABSL1-1]|uniref:AMP-binding protein n=1 Tax=Gordonia sp. ABSL1-1 TaxID=3053923 RepID=UPI002573555D|nr:AMP-binding protein [Gordonia sp. ABSL1-1]MDL9938973.1 AMP-binding protein [Gordonia sp. ABSL1-1]
MTVYPPEFALRYRERGYWIGQTHSALLAGATQAHPSRPAVTDDRRSLTYAELQAGVHGLAHGFAGLGLSAGDRVVVQMPNVSEYLEVVFALFDAGLVPIFALATHGVAEIDDLVTRGEADAYVTVDTFGATRFADIAATIRERHPGVAVVVAELDATAAERPAGTTALAEIRTAQTSSTGRSSQPDELAFLQLSGGTTGTPKLIPRTHDDYLYSVRESADICRLTPESVFGVVLPVSHNFTMSSPGVLGAIHAGAHIVMVGAPDAATVFAAVARHRITQLSAVPPLVAAWIDSPSRTAHDLSSLAVLQVGGAKLSRALAERVPDAFGVVLQQVFGMAEGLVNYTRLDDDLETIVGTQGRPISPDDEVRIVDPTGTPVADGTPGSLQVRGPYTIRGYWAGQSPQSFTDDGFYCTGDIVVRDDRGYLRVVGRDKDQINRAGEKIAPEEVENHLLTHAAVRDASVVGVPDDRLGERILAYVIPATSAQVPLPDEFGIRGYLRERGLARFKIPDQILVVDEFPTTAVGKVSKNAQRDGQDAVDTPDAQVTPHDAILSDFAGKLAIDPATLSGSTALADTGIDSLALMALLDKWRAQGAAGLDFETLATSETLDEMIAVVLAAQTRRAN